MVEFGGLKFGKRENMSDRRIWRERERERVEVEN